MLYSSLLRSVRDVSSVFRAAVSHGQRLWNCWRLCCVELSGGMDIMQLFSAFRFRQFLGTHFNSAAALCFGAALLKALELLETVLRRAFWGHRRYTFKCVPYATSRQFFDLLSRMAWEEIFCCSSVSEVLCQRPWNCWRRCCVVRSGGTDSIAF